MEGMEYAFMNVNNSKNKNNNANSNKSKKSFYNYGNNNNDNDNNNNDGVKEDVVVLKGDNINNGTSASQMQDLQRRFLESLLRQREEEEEDIDD